MYVTDEQLIKNYLDGDEPSLEILIKRYLKPIYNFVYRYGSDAHHAEEITQETFIKAWRNLKKFDQEKSFKTWLFSIAKNTAIDFLKKKKTVPFSAFEQEDGENMLANTLVDPSPPPQELAEKAGMARVLASAMEQLTLPSRTVLSLRYNNHYNFREIAESLDEPLDTVKSRHRRALTTLKNMLSA